MMGNYVLKIKIEDEWRFFRGYEIKEHAVEKYNEFKEIFDIALFDGERIIKQMLHGREF